MFKYNNKIPVVVVVEQDLTPFPVFISYISKLCMQVQTHITHEDAITPECNITDHNNDSSLLM